MEIDHDRLEKGVLNQEPSNGLNQHAGNGEKANGFEGGVLAREQHEENHHHQETLACLPQTQGWGPGHHTGASNPQQQQAGWTEQTSSSSANNVDMEDARTLVAFSASAGSLSACSVPQPSQNPTARLYEKFIKEMGGRRDDAKQKGWSGDDEPLAPEDLNTLQTALSQARHGHKPPNCDCDGPDCPDYLEWLEKKIKMATNSQDKGLCKMSGAPQTQQQHYQSRPQPQPTDANASCGSESQDPVSQPQIPRPYGPPAPIPCSPSVLSIAKERNVSLQTAIAIEALTQLSGTGGTVSESISGSSLHHASPQTPSQPQNGMQLVSAPHSLPPGHFPKQDPPSWEQHRPQSQGPTPHSSQYGSSPFPSSHPSSGSPFPQQWQTGPGESCDKNSPRNPWMMLNSESPAHFPQASHSGSDPMSELKLLLGDTSRKYTNPAFKFPAPHQNMKDSHKGGHSMMPYVKQEVDNGEYPGQPCAAMDQLEMVNGQPQQFQGQQLPQSIRHSTQAALQQLLHHKRNLFSSPPPFSPRTPMACQTLRKWWPQTTPEGTLAIKQEPKEPKKKKNAQSSPMLKQGAGGLLGHLASPLPKPKQIVIKKQKQKASQPVFLPQNQITVQKPPPVMPVSVSSLSQLTPSLPGMEAGLPHCLPPYNPSQVATSQAAPAQSQESILNSSSTPVSGNTPLISTPVSVPAPPAQEGLTSSGLAATGEATTSTPQTSTSQLTPPLAGLSSLDPKIEELIRQFEEEFGETLPTAPIADAQEPGSAPSVVTESQQNSNSGQTRPMSPSTEQLNNPLTDTSSQPEPMQEGEKQRERHVNNAEGMTVEPPVSSAELSAIKQEVEDYKVDVKPSDQLLSEAQEAYLQQQNHRMLMDPFTPPTKRVKLESSGNITVLSTTGCFSTPGDDTPTKDGFPAHPSLKGFLESPQRYLDTPTKSLLNTPLKDSQAEFPLCDCVGEYCRSQVLRFRKYKSKIFLNFLKLLNFQHKTTVLI